MSVLQSLILVLIVTPAAVSASYALHAAIAFRRRRVREEADSGLATSVIVPLCGVDEDLADNVRALASQRVAGALEVVLAAERDDESALAALGPLLRRDRDGAGVRGDSAGADVRVVIAGSAGDAPSKVHLLEAGVAAARGARLVFVDSDVRLPHHEFLAGLLGTLGGPRVGLATCVPVHREARGWGAALVSDLMHTDLIGLFAIGAAWGRLALANGACLAIRRDALVAAGELAPLRGRMLMDTGLARAVRRAGFTIALHREPVTLRRVRIPLGECARQIRRWHVSLWRALALPTFAGFVWLRLHATLALAALAFGPTPLLRVAGGVVLATRFLSFATIERGFVRARRPAWLYAAWPVSELVASVAWIPAVLRPTMEWRGRRYRVARGGAAVRIDTGRVERREIAFAGARRERALVRSLRETWRFLRVADWIVHWPIVLVAIAAYAAGAPQGIGATIARIAWILVLQSLLVAAGYLVNDVADRDADRGKLGAPRPPREVRMKRALAVAAIGAGLAMSVALGFATAALATLWVVLGIAYSCAPFRLKERGLVGVISAAALQRLVPFLMVVGWPPRAAALAVAIALWLFALGVVFILEHQLADVDDDLRSGIQTWTTRVGRARAAVLRDAAVAALWVCAALGAALVFAARVPAGAVSILAALVLPAATLLTTRLIAWRFAASRRLPHRPVLRATAEPVRIYGAGLAGLTAALALAEWGRDVEVLEQRLEPGGMASDLPYVHSLNEDPERIERWLGIPIARCFTRVSRETAYLNGWRVPGSKRHWNCVRGAMAGALDRHLLDLALARGIPVRFGAPFRPGDEPARGVTIVATGHSRVAFDALGLRSEPLEGYVSVMPWDGEPLLLGYRGAYTRSGYGYIAAAGGHLYALLFSRGSVEDGALAAFERDLARTEGIVMPGWTRRRGATPCATCFERRGFRLAGSVAGMIDPFYLSGIGPALVSGGVAALAEVDADDARRRFARLTRTFALKRALAGITWGRGASPLRVLGAAALNGVLAPVGTVRRG
ncbi:MAG TPA: glycosyltransferase [Candidatus Saccharimonadaceae bacterium]|nr:glycosyltransferase [Candidatus Saccharimonadaceae bacterium]